MNPSTKFTLNPEYINNHDTLEYFTPNELRMKEIAHKLEDDEKRIQNFCDENKTIIGDQVNRIKEYTSVLTNDEIKNILTEDQKEENSTASYSSNKMNEESSSSSTNKNQQISLLRKKILLNSKDILDKAFDKNTINKYRQIQEYLESKLFMYEEFRKKKFNEYYRDKDKITQTSKKGSFNLSEQKNAFFEKNKLEENCNKNVKKIQMKLLNLFELSESDTEESSNQGEIVKKRKLNTEMQILGYKISDFMKIPKYRINPLKMPLFSNYFEDAKKPFPLGLKLESQSFLTPNALKMLKGANARLIAKKKIDGISVASSEDSNTAKQQAAKASGVSTTLATTTKVENVMVFDNIKKQVLSDKDKEAAKQKATNMTRSELDKYEKSQAKKQWQTVVRGVIRIYRFTQKFKMEIDANCRKFSQFCAKEVKKKVAKSQRIAREHVLRAKKIHREVLIYWRKREKELNELRKRKERLEAEIKKREEEERENILQKKRLEFLMKQSDIYAHFMAQKLGIQIEEEEKKEGNLGQNQVNEEPKPEIDEAAAVRNVQNMINVHRQELQAFDEETQRQRVAHGGPEGFVASMEQCKIEDLLNAQNGLDFSNAIIDSSMKIVNTPKSFHGELKEYQLKGLRWLDNLYEQGINGILADEMGLGKTIQAIALLSHLSEAKGNWGPFLVVAPSSTLHNWRKEIKKFAPNLKVLPYWGGLKERKTIRKYFNSKNLGTPNSPFHIVVTSYQLVVADEKAFQRMKWQYMILDEAQAIKNTGSQRWKILLGFNARNRLLLTGTPIQNSMAELWALLHFIMPKLFDSHEQFQEWFSKDIEAHSQDQKALNQHQLQKLHAILKPFMLRRVKKDVENEIGQKKEIQVFCQMTRRQSELYNRIKSHLSIKDFFQMFESKAKVENLMNLVMQFRKVCNHPELFERKQSRTPFTFQTFYYYTGNMPVAFGQLKEIIWNPKNPIEYTLPKLIYDDLYSNFDGRDFKYKSRIIKKYFNVMSSDYVHKSLFPNMKNNKTIIHNYKNLYSFTRFMNIDPKCLDLIMKTDNLYSMIILLHGIKTMNRINFMNDSVCINDSKSNRTKNMLWINYNIINLWNINDSNINYYIKTKEDVRSMLSVKIKSILTYLPKSIAPYYTINCHSNSFVKQHTTETRVNIMYKIFYGNNYHQKFSFNQISENFPVIGSSYLDYKYIINTQRKRSYYLDFLNNGLGMYTQEQNVSNIEIPSFESMIADSTKLAYLNKLLPDLKSKGHRVLIFCQMTKMIDILEDFLNRRKYRFFRLDGSCNISDRRDMVDEFQTNPDIFAFVLSTRAGGLGVTLTAADVVIFYDNDWNPTMDAQATDRAHRIGQTKDVYVYRLVTKGTIEERIVKRAQQKQTVQATVYSGGAFKADIFKPQDVMELLFDENEIDINETKKFMAKSGARRKSKPAKKPIATTHGRGGRGHKEKIEKVKVDEEMIIQNDMDVEKGSDNEKKDGMDLEMDVDFSDLMQDDE